jgi:hypothetical protein
MALAKNIILVAVLCVYATPGFTQYLWGEGGIPILEDQDINCWGENIVKNDRGDIFMAWRDSRSDYSATYLQKFDQQGQPYWANDLKLLGYPNGSITLCPTSDDGLVFTWTLWSEPSHALIMAQKIDAVGNFLWPMNGVPVARTIAEGGGDQGTYTFHNLVADTAGGVFVISCDDRHYEFWLFAKHLLADGSTQPGWDHGGNPIHSNILFLDNYYRVVSCPDGTGGFIVSWVLWDSTGAYTQRMDGDGNLLWDPDGVVLSATGAKEAAVCPDGSGGAYYLWEDARFANQPMFMQRVSHEGNVLWQTGGILVGQTATEEHDPHIVPDGIGGVLAAWEIGGYNAADIRGQRLNGAGQKLWTPTGVIITSASGSQESSTISCDGAGGLYALWNSWTSYPHMDLYAQYITPAGTPAWTINGLPIRVGLEKTVQSLSVQNTDDAAALCFWWEHRNAREGLYMQKTTASGQFLFDPEGTPLQQGIYGGGDYFIMTAISPNRFLFNWTDTRNYYPGRLIYYQMCDAQGHTILTPQGVPLCAGVDDYQNYSCAAATSDGGAVIAWRDWRHSVVNGQVYVQKVDSGGNRLWPSQAVHVTLENQGHQTDPFICSDGLGGAYVNWRYGSTLFFQRLSAQGQRLFGPGGVSFVFTPYLENVKAFFSDGEFGAIVVYGIDMEWPIYASRISPEGAVMWTDTLYYLPYDPGWKIQAIPAQGGSGIVVWEDYRFGMPSDIYAQKFNNAGQNLWAANGVPVVTSSNVEHDPHLVEDTDGYVFIVWAKGYGDILCQRLSPQGVRQFPPEGLIVCNAADEQKDPGVVGDGNGGAIFNWRDERDNSYNSYALHLNAQGQIADPFWAVNGNPVNTFPNNYHLAWGSISDSSGGAVYGWVDVRGFCTQRINDSVTRSPQKKSSPGESISLVNSPNPFNPSTAISFKLQAASHVSLKVYDIAGRLVATLTDGWREAGTHEVMFDGSSLASGIYLYSLETSGSSPTGGLRSATPTTMSGKMLLLK